MDDMVDSMSDMYAHHHTWIRFTIVWFVIHVCSTHVSVFNRLMIKTHDRYYYAYIQPSNPFL
jgi:hypothetical protein